MRPPEFTGGNTQIVLALVGLVRNSFNEAAGIHRRKRYFASFTGKAKSSFNEAAGIHRRKRGVAGCYS